MRCSAATGLSPSGTRTSVPARRQRHVPRSVRVVVHDGQCRPEWAPSRASRPGGRKAEGRGRVTLGVPRAGIRAGRTTPAVTRTVGRRQPSLRRPRPARGPGSHIGGPETDGAPDPHHWYLAPGYQRPRECPPHPEVLLQILDRPERLIRRPGSSGIAHGVGSDTRAGQRNVCEAIGCPATTALAAAVLGPASWPRSPNSQTLRARSRRRRPGGATTLTIRTRAGQLRGQWSRRGLPAGSLGSR